MRIAVVFGGTSSERDVSIVSGGQVVRALRQRGHEVLALDSERGVLSEAQEREAFSKSVALAPPALAAQAQSTKLMHFSEQLRSVDLAFLALHGGFGENGTIQALLDVLGVAYTGSDARGSCLAMDKDVAKRLFRTNDIPTADWSLVRAADALPSPTQWPVVVKPNREGSTVGLRVVASAAELPDAVTNALRYDTEALIEQFIPGRELTVGVLGGQALAVGEIIPLRSAIFDYESKYQAGGAREVFPADVPAAVAAEAQRLALAVHRALKLGDYSRVDFRLDPAGKLWVLEANTLPGMTSTSLLPQSAGAVGIGFDELCERIVVGAIARTRRAS